MVDSCNCISELTNRFTCGGCCRTFTKICYLHDHLKEHVPGGSYHYDHVSKTAFPKYDTVCKYTQTLEEVAEKQSDGVKGKAVKKRVVKTVAETLQKENVSNDIAGNFKWKRGEKKIRQPENTMKKLFLRNHLSKKKRKVSFSKGTLQKQQKKKGLQAFDENEISLIEETSDLCASRLNRNGESRTLNEVQKGEKTSHSIEKQLGFNKLKEENTEIFTNSDKEIGDISAENLTPNKALKETVESMPFKKRKISKPIGCCKIAKKKKLNQSKTSDTVVNLNLKDDGTDYNGEHSEMIDPVTVMEGDWSNPHCKVYPLDTIDITSIGTSEILTKETEAKTRERLQHCESYDLMVLKQNRKSHKRRHRGKQEFVCEKCGKAFTRSLFLNRHLITHKNLKPWRCSVCSAQFCQKKEYNLHLAGHSGHTPFVCNVCDKRFLCKASLLTHQANIHMGLTHFECEICGRRFFKKSSYTIHTATHFEAKLKCSFCDKKFKDKTGLKRHEKTHTGIKRFQCHICKHGFIQSTPFWVHMEKIHGICRIKLKEKLKEVTVRNKRLGIKTDVLALPDGVDIEDLLTENDTEKLVMERTDQHESAGHNLKRPFDTEQMKIFEPPNLLKSNWASHTKVLHGSKSSNLPDRGNFSSLHNTGNSRSDMPPSDQAYAFPNVKFSLVPSIEASLRPDLSVNLQDSLEPSLETPLPGTLSSMKSEQDWLGHSMKTSLRSELPPSIQASVVPSAKAFLRSELLPSIQAAVVPITGIQASLRSNLPSSLQVSLVPSVQGSLMPAQVSVRSELPTEGQTPLIAPKRSESKPSLQASCVHSINVPVKSVSPPSVQTSFVSSITSVGQHQSAVLSITGMQLESATVADIRSVSTPLPLKPVYYFNKSSDTLKSLSSLEPSPSLIKVSSSGKS